MNNHFFRQILLSQVYCSLIVLLLATSAAPESADQKALEFRDQIAKRIDTAAGVLDNEAAHGSEIANRLRTTPASTTPEVLLDTLHSALGITSILRPNYLTLSSNVSPTAHEASFEQSSAIADTEDESKSLAGYARYLRTLADQVRKAPPQDSLALLDGAHLPSKVAIVLDPRQADLANSRRLTLNVADTFSPLVSGGGDTTIAYPAVGAILYDDGSGGLFTACTGTLIASNAVLTAAHCLNDQVVPSAPRKVYFHHSGTYDVAGNGNLNDHFDYDGNQRFRYVPNSFDSNADIALIFLTRPVQGILPAPINNVSSIAPNTTGRIIGFGNHRANLANAAGPSDTIDPRTGIKLYAQVVTGNCTGVNAGESLICWTYDASLAPLNFGTTCHGDSGGPFIAQIQGQWRLAGITSAAITCGPGDKAVDVDVFGFLDWIKGELQRHPAPPPAPEAHYVPGLEPLTNRVATDVPGIRYRVFGPGDPTWSMPFTINSDFTSMRVAVNATDSGARLQLEVAKSGMGPACAKQTDETAVECEVPAPSQGQWEFKVTGLNYQEYQVVVDTFKRSN